MDPNDKTGTGKGGSDPEKEPLSRRKILAGAASIGTFGAISGAGTTAFLADSELFANNFFSVGAFDLKLAWTEYYNPTNGVGFREEVGDCAGSDPGDFVDTREAVINLDGIQPGDTGGIKSCLHIFGNPGCVWMRVLGNNFDENGLTLPESEAGDTTDGVGEGELQNHLQMKVWYDSDCDENHDGGECEITSGSLAEVVDRLESGMLLDRNGFDGNCGTCQKIFKYELDEDQTENEGDLTLDRSDGTFTVYEDGERVTTIELRFERDEDDEAKTMDFSVLEGSGICRVDVKGGDGPHSTEPNGTKTYTFPCVEEASGLHAPPMDTPNSDPHIPAISHVEFYYCPGETTCLDNSTNYCIGFDWWLPEDTPKTVQTDSVEFIVEYYGEQARRSSLENPWEDEPSWGNTGTSWGNNELSWGNE